MTKMGKGAPTIDRMRKTKMSKYHVETTKITIIDGIEYKAEIDKDVDINFSAADYKVKMREDTHDAEIELIPDNLDFLHEMTELFPLSDYDYKIIQSIYRHIKPHVSLYFDIRNKSTGKKVYFAESALLTDDDYDYIRNILVKKAPQYDWRASDRYIRDSIESYMADMNMGDLFTDDAYDYLSRIVSARYKELKIDGYVDYDCDAMENIAKEIIKDALRNAYREQIKGV